MAEAFGIAAGAAGFASLLGQFVTAISTLRDIQRHAEKAPADISVVIKDLEFLVGIMSVAGKSPGQQDTFLQHCQTSCDNVAEHLRRLAEKISAAAQRGKREKLRTLLEMRHWKEDIGDLQRSLEKVKIEWLLYRSLDIDILLGNLNNLVLANKAQTPAFSDVGGRQSKLTATSAEQISLARYGVSVATSDAAQFRRVVRPNHHHSCTIRRCSCRCHHRARINRRFWTLEYNPMVALREGCDRTECNATEYGFGFRVALSQLGINWSLAIGLQVQMTAGRVGLRPSLQMERTVPYTSPGFELIWKCQNEFIQYEEAGKGLVELYRSDPTFRNHVAPNGESYIELLLHRPWPRSQRSDQFGLLELLMQELGITRGTETTRFLVRCVEWIYKSCHLELLSVLVELGFDTTVTGSPSSIDWPPLFSSSRFDPFSIECLKILSKDNQGFGGASPLHDAILCGSLESVEHWISRSEKHERNFLGQTAVHFAVSRFDCLELLIKAGYNLDQADNYGITPLMYAASMDQEEALIALLEAGADPYAGDDRSDYTLLHYAAFRGHWKLVIRIICYLEDVDKQVAEEWAKLATRIFYVNFPDYSGERSVSFRQLLAKCGDVNFVFADGIVHGYTLLHYISTVSDLEALLENGFQFIDHMNSAGQSALMICWGLKRPEIKRKLLEAGADINLRDNWGQSAIYYVLRELTEYRTDHPAYTTEILQLLSVYLANGADVLTGDKCRCSCSPSGCYPTAPLEHVHISKLYDIGLPIWSFECLVVLSEHRGQAEAKQILLSFIRKAKHEELGMTHVCCEWSSLCTSYGGFVGENKMSLEDIQDILEEESDFIDILEREMAQIADWDYESLLDYWISKIKSVPQRAREEAIQEKRRLKNWNKAPKSLQKSFTIDRENDRFVITYADSFGYCYKPDMDVILSVARYTLWLEHEYYVGHASRLSEQTRDGWYFRRISWLCRLISVLEVQTDQVTEHMRTLSRKELDYPPSQEKLEVEKGIRHFRQALRTIT